MNSLWTFVLPVEFHICFDAAEDCKGLSWYSILDFCTFWIQIDGHLHRRTQSIKDLYLWWTRAVVSLRLTSGVAFDHFNKSKPSMDILFTYNQFCNTTAFSSNLFFKKCFNQRSYKGPITLVSKNLFYNKFISNVTDQ